MTFNLCCSDASVDCRSCKSSLHFFVLKKDCGVCSYVLRKKNLVFGVSQIAKLAQVVAAGQMVAGGQMVARGVVAGGHSEKIKNFIKKALDNNILLVRGYKTPELYCQHDTIGTFYHFPSLQCVS